MINTKGSIELPMPNGEIKIIKDGCYVLWLNRNLISIGQIIHSKNLMLFMESQYLVLIL